MWVVDCWYRADPSIYRHRVIKETEKSWKLDVRGVSKTVVTKGSHTKKVCMTEAEALEYRKDCMQKEVDSLHEQALRIRDRIDQPARIRDETESLKLPDGPLKL